MTISSPSVIWVQGILPSGFVTGENVLFPVSGLVDYVAQQLTGGGITSPTRTITVSGDVTILTSDTRILLKKTVGEITNIYLPEDTLTDQTFIITDGNGDLGDFPATVIPQSGLIVGQATFVMDSPYQSIRLVYNGDNWSVE